MQTAAQLQSSIELLETIFEEKRPADRLMAQYFRDRRYIGSKDKAAISERVYGALRRYSSLIWLAETAGLVGEPRSAALVYAERGGESAKELFTGERYQPKALSEDEQAAIEKLRLLKLEEAPLHVQLNVPEWLSKHLSESLGDRYEDEMRALLHQATVDIRCNSLKTSKEKLQSEMDHQGFECELTPYSPWGLRFHKRGALFNQNAFKNGWFEVQDEGSQLLALATGVKAGDKVVDFCAGAGGKTLAMAAMMENKGVIHACDVHSKRLENLGKRSKRAGAHNIQVHQLSSERDKWVKRNIKKMDVVLIDAPCTGTGTWRRSPDAKWHLSQQSIEELTELQMNILESAARLVKPEGSLFYATCSLLQEENEEQIEKFLEANSEFELEAFELEETLTKEIEIKNDGAMLRTYPAQHKTDGFFAARLKRVKGEVES